MNPAPWRNLLPVLLPARRCRHRFSSLAGACPLPVSQPGMILPLFLKKKNKTQTHIKK